MNMKEKIQKLLDKASSTTHEAEAEVLLAKAEQLMQEHQINVMDLGSEDPMGTWSAYTATPSSPSWKNHVLNAVTKYYGAALMRDATLNLTTKKTAFDFVVIGAESARVTVELMYPFVLAQIREQGRASAEEMNLKPEAAIRRVGNAFCFQTSKLIAARKEAIPATAAAKNALVQVDALQAYMDESYGKLGTTRNRGASTNNVAKEAAEKVSLHRQTDGTKNKQLT